MDSFQPGTVKRLIQFMYLGDYDDPKSGDEASRPSGNDGGGVSGETEQEDGIREVESRPESTATASLFEHLRVNSIGDYYGVDKLVSLANTKIKRLLQEDKSWVGDLPSAIELATGSTGDEELLGILAAAVAANISTLLGLDQFTSLDVMTDFSIKVLQGCVREILQLTQAARRSANEVVLLKRRIESLEGQIQQKDWEISKFRRCLTILNQTSECRNITCDSQFLCHIDPDECILRCARCRCRHTD